MNTPGSIAALPLVLSFGLAFGLAFRGTGIGAAIPFTPSFLLLRDGVSFLLLRDGVSQLQLAHT